jgi:hypothetical protein
MRMHGVALKMMMSKDVQKVSAEFGFKRHVKYAGAQRAGEMGEGEDWERRWDSIENLSSLGKKLLSKIGLVLKMKDEIKQQFDED